MKRIVAISCMFLFYLIGSAQSTKSSYYFIVNTDTTFCKELTYGTTGQGYLNKLTYVDMEGKKTELKGRKNVPDVLTFYMNGTIFDKVPLKANKPKSYIRYTERVVDGKLKVYLSLPGTFYNAQTQRDEQRGIYRFYLKMPDGTYYKINSNGNMKKYIKPYLLQCKEFKEQYKGDFSTSEEPFKDMIKLYNSLCG